MIHSCNYEIWHTLNLVDLDPDEGSPDPGETSAPAYYADYTIYLNNKLIYSGRVYNRTAGEETVDIDIAPVCREYLDVLYEEGAYRNRHNAVNYISLPEIDSVSSINTFQVRNYDGSTVLGTYKIMYNYNSDYETEYPDAGNLNVPLLDQVDPRQFVPISGYNLNGKNSYQFTINGTGSAVIDITSQYFQLYLLNLNAYTVKEGDVVRIFQNTQYYEYKVAGQCRNRFVLYYVNELGGLDTLLCNGNYIPGGNMSHTNIKLYNNRSRRGDWEQKRLHTEITNRYELRFNFIKDKEAMLVKHLFASPKVWMHDLDKDTITSVLIRDTSYTEYKWRTDGVFTYVLNVEESQVAIRR